MQRTFCGRELKMGVLVAGMAMSVHLGTGGSFLVSELHIAEGLGG